MSEFRTKEDIDRWYDEAVDGVARAAAHIAMHDEIVPAHYSQTMWGLDSIKSYLYREVGVDGAPEYSDLTTLVNRLLSA